MNCRCVTVGWSLLVCLVLVPGQAKGSESGAPALRLGLAVASTSVAQGKAGTELHSSAGPTTSRFHFERQGQASRNLFRGNQAMCVTVSNKVWDEPNGRRIKFDIAGKPGLAVVIPIR